MKKMKIYTVQHEETGDHIGHGLYKTYVVTDGIYATREAAEKAVEEDDLHDCWVEEVEITG